MAFELWNCCLTHGETTAAVEVLETVVFQKDSSTFLWAATLGDLAYLFEILLGAAAAMLGAIGVLRSFCRNALRPAPALIAETCTSLSHERGVPAAKASGQDTEVTIRLDERHLWLLRRHRCVVTLQTPWRGAQIAEREVWYSKRDKSRP
jgi:hypothetical protein